MNINQRETWFFPGYNFHRCRNRPGDAAHVIPRLLKNPLHMFRNDQFIFYYKDLVVHNNLVIKTSVFQSNQNSGHGHCNLNACSLTSLNVEHALHLFAKGCNKVHSEGMLCSHIKTVRQTNSVVSNGQHEVTGCIFCKSDCDHSIHLYWKSILDGVGNGFVEDESYRDGKRNIHHDGLNVKIKPDPVFVVKTVAQVLR